MGVFFPMRQISVIFPGGFFPNFLFLKLKIKKKEKSNKNYLILGTLFGIYNHKNNLGSLFKVRGVVNFIIG